MDLNKYFKNKKVLITGNTGFKGSWLSKWLSMMGAELYTISKDIPTSPSHYELLNKIFNNDIRADISEFDTVYNVINSCKPDFVFHLAAQALVLPSYENPYSTFTSNTVGTLNILESLKRSNHNCTAVLITSDKCYENTEQKVNYSEDDRLGGIDPYSTSKASAELLIKGYNNAFFKTNLSNVRLCSARAGNVIGGGDWAINRIVPDCIKSWSKGETVNIRSPYATRPWQHVLEPIYGYLTLGAQLSENRSLVAESFNFGPINPLSFTVEELVSELSNHFDNSTWGIDDKANKLHEAGLLSLDCNKALKLLDYRSKLDFALTSEWTGKWYNTFYKHGPEAAAKMTENQIQEFVAIK